MNKNKERCNHCGKWVACCQLVTLPEEVYPLLDGDNEFAICIKCADAKTVEYWESWVVAKRGNK